MAALLINHGHFAFNAYDTGYDTLREDIFFASNGYVTIASDYRNYAGSDKGEYQLEPGYTYDVRNLLDAIRFVAPVDAKRVGMMGHSMGGGITQQVLVATQGQLKAATLYGTVSGDEVDNYVARHLSGAASRARQSPEGDKVTEHLRPAGPDPGGVPPHVADQLSGPHRLPRRDPSLDVADPICPFAWAEKLRDAFNAKGKPIRVPHLSGSAALVPGRGFQEYVESNLAVLRLST